MLETNKQALLFNFGEDLIYSVILRHKLLDFIQIYDDFVNDPIKGDFQKTLLLFQMGRKVSWNIDGFGSIQHFKAL